MAISRHSIRRRITNLMIASLAFILIGAVIVPIHTFRIVHDYESTTEQLNQSQVYIDNIALYTNEIILRVRGYFAYSDEFEYGQIFKAKDHLDRNIVLLRRTSLTEDERDLIERVERFFDNYLTNILPKGSQYVENGDYESLRELITLGASNPVNEIIQYANRSEEKIRERLRYETAELLRELFTQGLYFVIYIILVLIVSIFITRRLAQDIGLPISQLSQYTLNYARGEDIDIRPNHLNRKDEIGQLARSLKSMVHDIQEKEEELLAQNEELQAQEEELLAQNEELLAQQDELQAQQEELQETYDAVEGERQITQDMLNTIQEGIQLINMKGQTIQVNQKLHELLGLPYENSVLRGINLQDFKAHIASVVEDSDALFAFIDDALGDKAGQARSMQYVLLNNGERHIQLYWEPIFHYRENLGILLVHRDMTKEYEVDRMKSEFVSTVSHELRTPLASVLGFSELLLHREMNPDRQRKYLLTIHQEATRLTQLVNDFLDLQRIENGVQLYDFKPVDVAAIVKEVVQLQQAGTVNHSLTWSGFPDQTTVLGDRDKLIQVFVNLIGNAVKYSPEGGEIRLSAKSDGGHIRVHITDDGLGIPEQAIANLFTKFYRVDNSDRRQIGGTGLGLAIVKEIINKHNGEVRVQSELGSGSTFTVVLPVYIPVAEGGSEADE